MMPPAVRPSPLVFVVLLFALGNLGAAAAHAYSVAVPAAFLLLYVIGVSWGFSWWVLTDSRERKLATSIDHGWFVFYTWPFFVPYHALRTRGWRGCGLLLMLFGAFVMSHLIAVAIAHLLVRR